MRRVFVEARGFTAQLKALLDDESYRALQNELIVDPDKGDVMPGCGGLRKLRCAESRRGKGRRGGVRAIYLHLPEAERIDMIAIYSKGDQEDLTEDEKKILRALAMRARAEARKRGRRREES